MPLDEYLFVRDVAEKPAKVSLIGPDRISQRFAYESSTSVYRDMDAFLADVVAIERQIVTSLVEAGCRYVHIDAPGFTAYVGRAFACRRCEPGAKTRSGISIAHSRPKRR